MEVTIPTDPSEITLGKYIELVQISKREEKDELKAMRVIKAITGVPLKTLQGVPIKQIHSMSEKISNALTQDQPFQKRFDWKGKEYGFIPNLQDLSTGEFIDIDNFNEEEFIENLNVVLAVLYRPIVNKYGDQYEIEKYTGTEGREDDFLELPYSLVQGALGFFLRLGLSLSAGFLDSLTESEKKALYLDTDGTT